MRNETLESFPARVNCAPPRTPSRGDEEAVKADPPASVTRYRSGGKRLAAALASAASGLTDHDVEQVILALVDGRGPRGASEGDMARALDWAHGAFVEWALLRLVIEGRARIDFNAQGEVVFLHTPETEPQ